MVVEIAKNNISKPTGCYLPSFLTLLFHFSAVMSVMWVLWRCSRVLSAPPSL